MKREEGGEWRRRHEQGKEAGGWEGHCGQEGGGGYGRGTRGEEDVTVEARG